MQARSAILHEGFGVVPTDEVDHGLTIVVKNTGGPDGPAGLVIEGTNGQRIVLTEPKFVQYLLEQAALALPVVGP